MPKINKLTERAEMARNLNYGQKQAVGEIDTGFKFNQLHDIFGNSVIHTYRVPGIQIIFTINTLSVFLDSI